MRQKTILVITDGIGKNENDKFNAFANAKKPTYDYLFKNVPNSLIATSGLAVGLPEGQMGNSEVGHMSIGSGRILFQNLVKIDNAIKDRSLATNKAITKLLSKCQTIHIIGLYSDGGVHSHLEHFDAVYDIAKQDGKTVWAHAITDGRDVLPTSGEKFISHLQSRAKIATICGRFYAMDRDNRWDRVKLAYDTIANGENLQSCTPREWVQNSYKSGTTDEFILPCSFNEFKGIKPEDGIIFINFRNDRARQICALLGGEKFSAFQRDKIYPNLITMTKYDDEFEFEIIFPNEEIKDTLCEVISKQGLTQLHTAETEKYAHVTFFLNGGTQEPYIGETRVLIPSPKVKTYDEMPQMSAFEVADTVVKGIEFGYDFIVVNFANGDMVGHTGNYEAAIQAVQTVDSCLGKIIKAAKKENYAYVQISDHGNCEAMRDSSENALTNHTTFDVFCFVLANGVSKISNGRLSNIAPTILKIMDITIPKAMDKPLF